MISPAQKPNANSKVPKIFKLSIDGIAKRVAATPTAPMGIIPISIKFLLTLAANKEPNTIPNPLRVSKPCATTVFVMPKELFKYSPKIATTTCEIPQRTLSPIIDSHTILLS